MTILDTFYILFDSDASKLDKGLDASEHKAGGLIDKLKGVDAEGGKAGAALFELVGKTAGILGLGMSVGALVAGVRETAASYNELGKLAARFRSTTDAVDEFRDAAGLIGISEETSVDALKSLDTAMQDTFLGMGRAKKVFEEMGISVTDVHGKIKPTTEVMEELAEKMKGMEKGTQIRVMERLGLDPSLLKLFNSDLVGLQKRMADVDRASGFSLEEAVKRSEEYTKASKGLGVEVNTLKMYLEKMTEGLKVSAMPFFTDSVKSATRVVQGFVGFLLNHSKFMEGVFIAVSAAIAYFLIPSAISGAVAVWAMVAPFVAVGAAVLAIGAAFALVYDDIQTFREGGDSLIGGLIKKWPLLGEIIKGLAAELGFVGDVARAVGTFLTGVFDDPTAAFAQFRSEIEEGVTRLIEQFPGLQGAISDISTAFTNAGETITGVWDAVVAAIRATIATIANGIATVANMYRGAKSLLGFGPAEGERVPNNRPSSSDMPPVPSPEEDVPTPRRAPPALNDVPTPRREGEARQEPAAFIRPQMAPPALIDLARGREHLAMAASSPLSSQTSSSIANTTQTRNTTVTIEKVEVSTQATDAQGVSRAIGNTLQAQMKQAVSNYDDGVAG